MKSKKQKFNPVSLIGKDINTAYDLIYADIDYTSYGEFYWLSADSFSDNRDHFIRFPYGSDFTMAFNDNNIVTDIY